MLCLSIAVYKFLQVIRVGVAVSDLAWPARGIVVGPGGATTEMRIVLIHIVDRALSVAPYATPTLYVDDLSVEAVGGTNFV